MTCSFDSEMRFYLNNNMISNNNIYNYDFPSSIFPLSIILIEKTTPEGHKIEVKFNDV